MDEWISYLFLKKGVEDWWLQMKAGSSSHLGEATARRLNECKLLASITNHPNIVYV